jgi:hypothetical protein
MSIHNPVPPSRRLNAGIPPYAVRKQLRAKTLAIGRGAVIPEYDVSLWHAPTKTRTLLTVLATTPDEAMTIAERQGHDYTEAEISLGGQQVAVYSDDVRADDKAVR